MNRLMMVGLGLLFLVPFLTKHTGGIPRGTPFPGRQTPIESQKATGPSLSQPRPSRARHPTPDGAEGHPALGTVAEAGSISRVDPHTIERRTDDVPAEGLRATLDALGPSPSAETTATRQILVRRWATFDLPAALAWVLGQPEGAARSTASEQIALAWANLDLPGSIDWVGRLAEGDGKAAATLSIAYEAVRTDPLAALRLAATLPAAPGRDALLEHCIRQWAEIDVDSATTWSLQVQDSALRERLIASAAISMANRDAEAALALVVSQIPTGGNLERTVVSIAQRWNPVRPDDALTARSELTGGLSRDEAAQTLQSLRESHASFAGVRGLADLPESIQRDIGIMPNRVP